jgi:hypothetical protein
MTDWISIANQIEDNSEHIGIRYFHYLLDHPELGDDKMKIILDFADYCVAENQKDLDTPRAPDGKSFNQRREEQKKSQLTPSM